MSLSWPTCTNCGYRPAEMPFSWSTPAKELKWLVERELEHLLATGCLGRMYLASAPAPPEKIRTLSQPTPSCARCDQQPCLCRLPAPPDPVASFGRYQGFVYQPHAFQWVHPDGRVVSELTVALESERGFLMPRLPPRPKPTPVPGPGTSYSR